MGSDGGSSQRYVRGKGRVPGWRKVGCKHNPLRACNGCQGNRDRSRRCKARKAGKLPQLGRRGTSGEVRHAIALHIAEVAAEHVFRRLRNEPGLIVHRPKPPPPPPPPAPTRKYGSMKKPDQPKVLQYAHGDPYYPTGEW